MQVERISSSDPYHDGKSVLCLVLGSSVNQDGRSSSLTAPNGKSQESVICDAWQATGLGGLGMSSLGMHGTGTPLGDPIEVGAAVSCLNRTSADRNGPVALQANKSILGHGEAVAGISALLYAMQSVGSSSSKAIIHLQGVNPHASAAMQSVHNTKVDFMVPRESAPAPTCKDVLKSGVSSFAYQVLSHAPFSLRLLELSMIPELVDYLAILPRRVQTHMLPCKRARTSHWVA